MIIVVDENIPGVEALFGQHATQIRRVPGRHVSAEDVKDADALIVRSVTKVNAELLRGSRVSFVGTCTIGQDHLDIAAIEALDIAWASAPGCNADSVADYVMAACASLDKSLDNKNVAVVGCGNVGTRVARRMQSLGANVKAVDPNLTQAAVPLIDLGEALAWADVVCMHTPLVEEGPHPSRGLINEHNIHYLRNGALVINAGRGPVLTDAALFARDDIDFVIDVWDDEPAVRSESIARAKIATSHIAGYANEAKLRGTWMVFNAWAEHLGLPQVNWEVVAGEPLERPTPLSDWQQQILSVYDIQRDDQLMRQALVNEASANAVAFDKLRKTYPGRHEYASFQW